MDFLNYNCYDNLSPTTIAGVEINFMPLGIFQKMLFDHVGLKFMKVIFNFSLRWFTGHVWRIKGRLQAAKSNGLVGTDSQKDLNALFCRLCVVDD